MSEAGLAQSGRSVKKDVVDRLSAAFGRRDGNLQIILGFLLSDKVGQAAGAQAVIERCILFAGLTGYYACYLASPLSQTPLDLSTYTSLPLLALRSFSVGGWERLSEGDTWVSPSPSGLFFFLFGFVRGFLLFVRGFFGFRFGYSSLWGNYRLARCRAFFTGDRSGGFYRAG